MLFTIKYTIGDDSKLKSITMVNQDKRLKVSIDNPDQNENFRFRTRSEDEDSDWVTAQNKFDLGNAILNGQMFMGLIPPQEFKINNLSTEF